MPEAFDFSVPPFDRLTPAEQQRLTRALDVGVYGAGDVLIECDRTSDSLFVVLSGLVHERSAGTVVAAYGPQDTFDIRALFTGPEHVFEAAENTLCYLLPRDVLLELARLNESFGAYVYRDFAERLQALASRRDTREMAALTMATIRQAYLHPAVFLPPAASLRDAAVAMKEQQATAILVTDEGGRTGIVTGTDLRERVIVDGRPVTDPVGPVAHYDLVTLDRGDLLFNALVLMTKHSVRRVVVTEDDAIVGLLEQADLLGTLSNHSQVVALKVEKATSTDDLARASADMLTLIRTLHATGVKVPFIAELVTELNRKIFRRLFEMLAPPDLLANSCLLVMGSEGRGEQILKTDQDNGLILRDGYTCPDLDRVTAEFTRTLVSFGYPPCPGNIMVSNPEWTRPLASYKDALFHWIHRPDENAQLNLAIFFDAEAVAGDPALLAEAKHYLLDRLSDNQGFFSHFARPVLAFDTPTGLFGGLFERKGAQPIDIKKAAIFPIVHGIRALALEKHLVPTNTTQRIWALADKGLMERDFAADLAEAFTFLSTLRLKARVDSDGAEGGKIDNSVRPAEMSKMDRDQFNDCLALVKKFKEFISYHFHLNMH